MPTDPAVESAVALVKAVRDDAPGRPCVVLVDGPAGAGKTTFANRLAVALGGRISGGAGTFDPGVPVARDVRLLHCDDMYEGWGGLAGLPEVLVDGVLAPLRSGRDGAFQMWDWGRGERTHVIPVPAPQVLIVEGVGAASAAAREYADVVVYVDAPWPLRLERGITRDGEEMRAEWEKWQESEPAHFEAEGTRAAAHLLVDGTRESD